MLDELNHNLRIADGVLRFRIFKVDPRSPSIVPPPAMGTSGAPTRAPRRDEAPAEAAAEAPSEPAAEVPSEPAAEAPAVAEAAPEEAAPAAETPEAAEPAPEAPAEEPEAPPASESAEERPPSRSPALSKAARCAFLSPRGERTRRRRLRLVEDVTGDNSENRNPRQRLASAYAAA